MKQSDSEIIFESKRGLHVFMIQTAYDMRYDPSWRGIRDSFIQASYPYNYIPKEDRKTEAGEGGGQAR